MVIDSYINKDGLEIFHEVQLDKVVADVRYPMQLQEYWYYIKDKQKIYHRDDNLPCFLGGLQNGGSRNTYYRYHGKFHRTNGAARVLYTGQKFYYINGVRLRHITNDIELEAYIKYLPFI